MTVKVAINGFGRIGRLDVYKRQQCTYSEDTKDRSSTSEFFRIASKHSYSLCTKVVRPMH